MSKQTSARYRFRTAALIGPWRETEGEALEDACRARLCLCDGNKVVWRVPAEIQAEARPRRE